MVTKASLPYKLLLLIAICQGSACFGKDNLRVSETAEKALQRHQHKTRGQEKRPMASVPNQLDMKTVLSDDSPNVEMKLSSSQKPPILQMKKQPPGRTVSMSAAWTDEVHHSSARTVSPKQLMRKENDSMKGKPKVHRSSGMQSSKNYPKKRRGAVNQGTGQLPHYWKIRPEALGPLEPFDASIFYPTLTPTTVRCGCLQAACGEQQLGVLLSAGDKNRDPVKCNFLSSC